MAKSCYPWTRLLNVESEFVFFIADNHLKDVIYPIKLIHGDPTLLSQDMRIWLLVLIGQSGKHFYENAMISTLIKLIHSPLKGKYFPLSGLCIRLDIHALQKNWFPDFFRTRKSDFNEIQLNLMANIFGLEWHDQWWEIKNFIVWHFFHFLNHCAVFKGPPT